MIRTWLQKRNKTSDLLHLFLNHNLTKKVAELVVPWWLFMALLLAGWRVRNLFGALPAYGDVLEVLWGINWYHESLFVNHNSPFFYPLTFHPQGWYVATFAYMPTMFAHLLTLNWIGGAAFAYNASVLLSFVIAFGGMYRLARRFGGSLSATVAALLFTFWGLRWIRVGGHLNVLWGSSWLPWMIWGLDRAFRSTHRQNRWFGVAGLFWGLMIANTLYFIWIGGIVLLGWSLGRHPGARSGWIIVGKGVMISILVALVFNAPGLYWFIQGTYAASAPPHAIQGLNSWGASLNTLFIPFVGHPWFYSIARRIYRGIINESSVANFGFVAFPLALISLRWTWRDKTWRPVVTLAVVGLILTLGLTLKWDGESIRWRGLRPINAAIWHIGHRLKPTLFVPEYPPYPFDAAVPMPALLLAAIMPFWEGARVLSRYGLIASIGIYLLASLGLGKVRSRFARIALATLLIIEVVPPITPNLPYPPQPHPAFEWLKQQPLEPGEGIADLFAPIPWVVALPIEGRTLWATRIHGKPTVAGSSGVWPAHTVFLNHWLLGQSHPFQSPEFVPVLRYYGVRFIVMHVRGKYETDILQEVPANKEISPMRCFDPPSGPTAWPYPICVIEVLPSSTPQWNALRREGWSGPEDWGVWAEGQHSRVQWVAPILDDYQLTLEAFPYCVPNRQQTLTAEVNGISLGSLSFDGCSNLHQNILLPRPWLKIGWNTVTFSFAYALRPVDVTKGTNPDIRPLSVGFTQLKIEQANSGE